MKVVFSAEALSQLKEIARYIAADNKDRARSFAKDIRGKASLIGETPFAFPVDERLGQSNLRRRVYRDYLIFYRVEFEHVRIVAIIHGARDYEPLLRPAGPPQ